MSAENYGQRKEREKYEKEKLRERKRERERESREEARAKTEKTRAVLSFAYTRMESAGVSSPDWYW